MNFITFDRLAYVRGLRSGGFTEEQAEAAAIALDGAKMDAWNGYASHLSSWERENTLDC